MGQGKWLLEVNPGLRHAGLDPSEPFRCMVIMLAAVDVILSCFDALFAFVTFFGTKQNACHDKQFIKFSIKYGKMRRSMKYEKRTFMTCRFVRAQFNGGAIKPLFLYKTTSDNTTSGTIFSHLAYLHKLVVYNYIFSISREAN